MTASVPATEPQTFLSRLNRFFFAEEVPYGAAAVRILLPTVLLFVVVPRWFHARELFSTDGAPAPLADNYGWFDFLPEPSGAVAVGLMTLLAFVLTTAAIGWHTRISLVIAAIVYPYLNLLDCLSTMTKYSVIASHILLLLAVSRCGDVWSVDSWRLHRGRRRSAVDPAIEWPRSPVWPQRLIQLLMGLVYFGAAITKMQTPEYFNGDQLLYWLMSNVNNSNPIGEWLTVTPWILVFFAYIAVVWEVLFVFLVWRPLGRMWMLGLGAVFHIMTVITLGLFIFPPVCISAYMAFLTEDDVRRAARSVRRLRRKLRRRAVYAAVASARVRTAVSSALARLQVSSLLRAGSFACVTAAVVGAGLVAEKALDPYGLRQPGGPHRLEPLDRAEVERMFAGTTPIRNADKLVAFDVGRWMISDLMAAPRSRFREDEPVLAQVRLAPPHEDLWVECNLHDADDRVIDRAGQIAPRGNTRCNFLYKLTSALEPGDYFLVCRINGDEVARKRVHLSAEKVAASSGSQSGAASSGSAVPGASPPSAAPRAPAAAPTVRPRQTPAAEDSGAFETAAAEPSGEFVRSQVSP